MKLKYYLRGIGIGIIMTTVILMITFAVNKEQPLSDDEIRARAMELGMVMAEDLSAGDKLSDNNKEIGEADGAQGATVGAADEETPEPEEDTAGQVKDNEASEPEKDKEVPEPEKNTAGQTKDDKSEGTKDGSLTEDPPKTASDKSDKDQPQTEEIEQVEITIVGGEYSDAVCKKLKKAGVIDDAEAFNKYLSRKGYDNLIQPGTYVVPLGASYATVAKLITDKKNRKEG